MCLPLLMVSGSPDASLHWSLFVSLPVWLSTASGVRLSRCLFTCLPSFVSRSGQWCFPIWPVLSGSLGVSLYVSSFMCLPLWLVAVRMSSLSICLPIHLSPNSFVFNHQSTLVVVSDSFVYSCVSSIIRFSPSVSHFICVTIHMSPLAVVSCSCFITISFVIGHYLCSFSLCVFLLSQELHQHRPQIAITLKNSCL